MAQTVMIQTEPMVQVTSPKAAAKAEGGQQEAFSTHFDKQIKQGEANSQPREDDTVQAANLTEADNDIAADGKNLPTETSDEGQQTEASENTTDSLADVSAETLETTVADADSDSVAVGQTPQETASDEVPSTAQAEEPEVVVATTSSGSTESVNKTDKPAVADKPIRAQVTVSQNAVDHAKAAPVEMTAKTHPREVQAAVDDKPATVKPEQSNTVAQTVSKTVTESIKAIVSDTTPTDKPVSPNLAEALKQISADNKQPPQIRADILDALQRQHGKQEITTNLRNLIAAQTQQAEGKPAVTLPPNPADATLPDSRPLGLNSATSLSGLVSTAQGAPALATTAHLSSTVSLPVQPNMQSAAWGQVMSSRVVWMAKEGVQTAELRMTPANLGPVEVKLHIQNDQASVTFLAQHSATRDALEQALPRLRESFAESGMELTNAQVGEQQQQQQEQSEQASDSHIFAQASRQDDDIDTETVETVSSGEAVITGLSLYA